MGLFESVVRQVLTEDKVTDYIKRLVVNNVDDEYKPYLKDNFKELPSAIRNKLHDDNEAAYNACMEHDMNVVHYFRLVFLKYFGLNHGEGPVNYVVGLARIAIEELKLLKENHNHDDMSKLRQIVNFINEHQDLLDTKFDKDLNGMNFKQLKEKVYPVYEKFVNDEKENLSNIEQEQSDYDIVPIMRFEDAHKYGDYTSWCVTHERCHFDSYTREGERFYFCLKHGFEELKEPRSYNREDKPPLDEYGLSMISVLVDMDGRPVHITTRWNHAHDGEDNPGLCTAEQVQKVVGVNFYDTFKPFTEEELQELRDNGDYNEDESVREERYNEQRDDDGLFLWDDVAILRPYDSEYIFTPGEDYDIFNLNIDDTDALNAWCIHKNPIWIDNQAQMAIFQIQRENSKTIVLNSRFDNDVILCENITSYQITELPQSLLTVIFYIRDSQDIGFICENGCSEEIDDRPTQAKHNFVDGNDDEQIVIRTDIIDNDYDTTYAEFIRTDGLHCLYSVDKDGYIENIISDFPPEGCDRLAYDKETDTVIGVTRKYCLSGVGDDEEQNSEYQLTNVVRQLYDDYYVVSVLKNGKTKLQNVIRRGEKELLVKPDAEVVAALSGVSRYVVLRLSDYPGNNNNIESINNNLLSVLYDLELQKIVTKPHANFKPVMGEDLILSNDDTYTNYSPRANFIFNTKLGIEAGPFKVQTQTCRAGKFVVTDDKVTVYDSSTFKPLIEAEKWMFIMGPVINNYDKDVVVLQRNGKIFLYLYQTLELLDENPLGMRTAPKFVGDVLVYKYEDGSANAYDFRTNSKFTDDPQFANGFIDIEVNKHELSLLLYTKNHFCYPYLVEKNMFLPSKNGIDLKYVSQIVTNEAHNFRILLKYNEKFYLLQLIFPPTGNGKPSIGIKDVTAHDDWYYCNTTNLATANVDPELMKVINQTLYPAEKAAVTSSFNEMIDKFSKIRNGSILN